MQSTVRVVPVCGLGGCQSSAAVRVTASRPGGQVQKRCDAHKGKHVLVCTVQKNRRENRPCLACGVMVSRVAKSKYRTFCSPLCKRWVLYGAWSSTFRPKALPKPPKVKHEVVCVWCGDEFRSNWSNARYCGQRCKDRSGEARRRALKIGAGGSYSRSDLRVLWELFAGNCAYCCAAVDFDVVQPDHVVALAAGGSNDVSNILPVCPSCNASKRELSLSDWADWRSKRGLASVVTMWDESDPRYSHLTGLLVAV